jgi:hypothetical protein
MTEHLTQDIVRYYSLSLCKMFFGRLHYLVCPYLLNRILIRFIGHKMALFIECCTVYSSSIQEKLNTIAAITRYNPKNSIITFLSLEGLHSIHDDLHGKPYCSVFHELQHDSTKVVQLRPYPNGLEYRLR